MMSGANTEFTASTYMKGWFGFNGYLNDLVLLRLLFVYLRLPIASQLSMFHYTLCF
jgi:hypothetical protein